jgi:hypothetical protein
VSSFIGHEQGKAIVEDYDKQFLFPMLLKWYYHLHPLVEYERGVVDQRVEEDRSLDIFEMTTNTSEATMKSVNRELLIFRHYQVNVKDIKCPLTHSLVSGWTHLRIHQNVVAESWDSEGAPDF